MSRWSLRSVFRVRLSKIVDDAERAHPRYEITRNGHRTAVLLAADDFDAMQETIAVLSDQELLSSHLQGVVELSEDDSSKPTTPTQHDTVTAAAKPKRKASSVNWDVDVLDGLRAAAHYLPHIPESGLRSLSDIVNTAAREKVAELESAYNNGEPFPRVGRLSAGRKP